METSTSSVTKARNVSRVTKWLVISLILLAIFIALIPTLSKLAVVSWLSDQGVGAKIENIDIDYVDAKIDVFHAKGQNQQGQGFAFEHVHIDIAWQPLFDKVLKIEYLKLVGLQLDIVQGTKGLQSIAGIDFHAQQRAKLSTQGEVQNDAWRVELAQIQLAQLEMCYQVPEQQHLCLGLLQMNWQGNVVLDANQTDANQLNIKGALQFTDVVLQDKQHQQLIMSGNTLQLTDIKLDNLEQVAIAQIGLEQWQFLPIEQQDKMQPVAQWDSVQLSQLSVTKDQLSLQQVLFEGFGAYIQRDKQGQWQAVQQLEKLLAKNNPPISGNKAPAEPSTLSFKLNDLQFQQGRPIVFVDQQLSSPLKVTAQIKTLQLKNIDTQNTQQPSQLGLHVITDQHGSINLAGQMQLLSEVPSFDLAGEIKGLDLRPVSVYLESGVGQRIKSGQLNAKLKLLAEQGKLNSVLDLDLKQFQLKKKTSGEPDAIDVALGMPVDSALNLLRNRDKSIQLAIPITGDVNNPQFDPSDAIYKATSKAITSAIISYYTPFGLVTAVEGLVNLATAIHFEPVVYEPASDVLIEQQQVYLQKTQQLLTERPQLHLSLCGFSNQSDLNVLLPDLAEQLKERAIKLTEQDLTTLSALATRRAEAVKQHLIENGIEADRLILCDGDYDKDGIAGVDISI